MMPKWSPEQLYLGSPDAWGEQERDHLEQNFLPIRQFSEISAADKVFLCGRRGTGKSAIAVMLSKTGHQTYCASVPGESDHYGQYLKIVDRLHRLEQKGVETDLRFSVRRLWLWVIQVKSMQVLLGKAQASDRMQLEPIRSYLEHLPDPLNEDSDMGTLLSNIFRVAVGLLQKDGEDAYDKFLEGLVATPEFLSAINCLRDYMSPEKGTAGKSMLIVLDTLESYKIFQPFMVDAFRGIVDAMISLWADQRMDHIYLKLFLPAEVFDKVFESYPGKTMARAVFMRWRSADLISMLGRRFVNVLGRTQALQPPALEAFDRMVLRAYEEKDGRHLRKNFWYGGKFLPKTILNRNGDEEDCFAYMFRHTQRRPRDIIAQMQSIIETAAERGTFPYIDQASVIDGVHRKRLLEQIVAESLTPFEGKLPAPLKRATQTLLFQKACVMNWRELKHFSEGLYNIAPMEDIDPKDFVEILANCGLIGLVDTRDAAQSGNSIYTRARFEYIMQGTVPLADGFHYCVHPALGDFLEMTIPPGYKAIYPFPETLEDAWLEQETGIA